MGKARKKEKRAHNQKGVTIIVLIVMIIVLLILAGITLSALIGDNGIINRTIQAKLESDLTSYSEELDVLEVQTKTEQVSKRIRRKRIYRQL